MKIKQNTSVNLTEEERGVISKILEEHQTGYSLEFPPERITLVRSIIEKLK
jgi:hypothetical protein